MFVFGPKTFFPYLYLVFLSPNCKAHLRCDKWDVISNQNRQHLHFFNHCRWLMKCHIGGETCVMVYEVNTSLINHWIHFITSIQFACMNKTAAEAWRWVLMYRGGGPTFCCWPYTNWDLVTVALMLSLFAITLLYAGIFESDCHWTYSRVFKNDQEHKVL